MTVPGLWLSVGDFGVENEWRDGDDLSVFVDEMGRFVSFSRKNIEKGYNFAADLVKTDRMVQKEVKQERICGAGVGDETAVTRELVMRYESTALIIWGISAMVAALAVFVAVRLTGDARWSYLWAALPVVAGRLHGASVKSDGVSVTALYGRLASLSRYVIVLIALCALLSVFVAYNAYAVILFVLSMWCAVSGFMLDYRNLKLLAVGGNGLALICSVMSHDLWHIVVFAAGVAVTLALPGLLMKAELRRQH